MPPPPPHQTLHFPADTACGPVSPTFVWSATSVPAVHNNVDKLHKSLFMKPSHDGRSKELSNSTPYFSADLSSPG